MRVRSQQGRGFTLIELLIVVAIIAILAAIAVPNFLEAQMRAKVSRVRSDFRTLAIALEAYYVDWNSYTFLDTGDSWSVRGGWYQLTSPVAYTTSIPHDPFGESRYADGTKRLDDMYELGSGAVGVGTAGQVGSPGKGIPADTWEMSCVGPDHRDDTLDTANFGPGHQYTWNEASYPWTSIPANNPAAVAEALTLLYDPTNGTVSRGNILRFGGMKPPGQVFDVLFANASK
jgi:prepilin-type N-terminal cleavage/methylation domain-containing protein